MVTYHRIPFQNSQGYTAFRYTRGNLLCKESSIPPVVLEKFDINDTITYDDKPSIRRCLFCDDYQSRQRMVNGETVELCEWHYQHMNLGKIAAQIALLERNRIAGELAAA